MRPVLSQYQDIALFAADMIRYRKQSERNFTVQKVCQGLRRLSPTLVTLIIKKKRRLTLDRVEEFSKVLGLTFSEQRFLRDFLKREISVPEETAQFKEPDSGRKETPQHFLKDWIHPYVKDAFQLPFIQENPERIYALLAGIASQKRIDHAILYLRREGYLRKTEKGTIVPETNLHVIDRPTPGTLVRQFHKGALKTAIAALDTFPVEMRNANALIFPLDQKGYETVTGMIRDFTSRLQEFAASHSEGDVLYQLVIHLSPTGGNPHE